MNETDVYNLIWPYIKNTRNVKNLKLKTLETLEYAGWNIQLSYDNSERIYVYVKCSYFSLTQETTKEIRFIQDVLYKSLKIEDYKTDFEELLK